MSHNIHYIVTDFPMSIGNSGRIVIEVNPALKKDLYSALAKEGLSLKEWFLKSATAYLHNESLNSLKSNEKVSAEVAAEDKK